MAFPKKHSPLHRNKSFFTTSFFILLIISACSNYSIDINQNEVYRPPTLYTNYELADENLHNCVRQTIRDNGLNSPQQLLELRCTYAGIKSLEGLAQFSRIERLSLKGNQLESINELLQFTRLTYLDISENNVHECQTISQLRELLESGLIETSTCD